MRSHHSFSNSHSKQNNNIKIDTINLLRQQNINSLKSRYNYELMYEAFYIANLFYDLNETSKHQNDKSFYILSTSWFEKWKKYVNFDKYMYFHSKYLSINSLPIRPREAPLKETFENLLKNHKIKDNLLKYFNSLFLTDNSDKYPYKITNELLLYDKKLSFYNYDNKDSNYNYNIDDKFIYGKDYIIVTRNIWKFFYYIYGGKEIRRYNLNRGIVKTKTLNLFNQNTLKELNINNKKNAILIESKLKTLKIVIIRSNYKQDFKSRRVIPFIIDSPKNLYVSHKFTIKEVKEKIKETVLHFKGRNADELRLWILKDKTYQNFVDEIIGDYKRHSNYELRFPGISLDIFGQNTKIEDLDNLFLINVIIVVESKIHMGLRGNERYIFKKDKLDDKNDSFKDFVYKIRDGKNLNDKNIIQYKDSLYQKIFYTNINGGYSKNNFIIKDYFTQKYQLDKIYKMNEKDIENFIKRISDYKNENNSKLKELFIQEVYNLKENMDLIIDESELITKVGGIYSNMIINKEKNKPQLNLNMDMIMTKRKRKQFEQENKKFKYYKNNNVIELSDSESDENELENNNIPKDNEFDIDINKIIDIDEDKKEKFYCNYCEKLLDDDFIVCNKCGNVKYCNIICKNKDIRFHYKTCIKITRNKC